MQGTESRPLNCWRTVLLTDAPDARFVAVFDRIGSSPWLPEFIEIYIRDVLEIGLERRAG